MPLAGGTNSRLRPSGLPPVIGIRLPRSPSRSSNGVQATASSPRPKRPSNSSASLCRSPFPKRKVEGEESFGRNEAVLLTVSVGICAHNEGQNIGNVVGAVLREPLVDELIVVASGCTDSTIERLESFEADHRLRVIVEPERTGKTPAFNI